MERFRGQPLRGLSRIFRTDGRTTAPGTIEIESPIQVVTDVDRIARYNSHPQSVADDGWLDLVIDESLTGVGFSTGTQNVFQATGVPAEVDDNPEQWAYWICGVQHHAAAAVSQVDIGSVATLVPTNEFGQDSISRCIGLNTVYAGTSLVNIYPPQWAEIASDNLQFVAQSCAPFPVFNGAVISLVVRNDAANGLVEYTSKIFGKFLPRGVPFAS